MGKKKKNTKKKAREHFFENVVQSPRQEPEPTKRKRSPWIWIVPILILVGVGLIFILRKSSNQVQAGDFKNYNVLFISLDTLRADHLPIYGYKNVKTPNLDAIGKQSYVFTDAISHVPLTLPAHTSMMTGILPIANGVRDNAGFFLNKADTTLAEVLKSNQYATAAFVSAFVLDSRWNLDQGFDLYYDHFNLAEFKGISVSGIQRRADETEIEAEKWIDQHKDKPFFCWVHYYDPHDPYDPPEPFRTEYADHPYDGEIAYTDVYVGKLLDRLKYLKIDDRTIVVVVGDHGESLGEHHEATHAMFVYNTTQHVPLMIHLPGKSGGRVKGVVRQIDIMPTLLQLLGAQVPQHVQGLTMIPDMNGKPKQKRVAYSESIYAELHYGWSPLESLTTDDYRFINAPRPELYNRLTDTGDTKNLVSQKPAIAKVMKEKLEEITSRYSKANNKQVQAMDRDTEEKLRSLGYIGSSRVATEESRKIDPKDKIHLAQGVQNAFSAIHNKDYSKALNFILPVLREDPDMIDGHFIAGSSYIELRKYDQALDELMKTIALKPDHTTALYNIGYVYEMEGKLDEARTWYEKVLKYEPKQLFATMKLAHIHRQLNHPTEARNYFLQAIGSYKESLSATKGEKNRSTLYATIGEIYFGAGDIPEAEKNFDEAIKLTPDRPSLHYNLAQIYEAKGEFGRAVEAYKKETEINPQSYNAFNNLGLLYKQARQFDNAIVCFERCLQIKPDDAQANYLLAETLLLANRDLDRALQLAKNAVRLKPEFHRAELLIQVISKNLGRAKPASYSVSKPGE